MMEKGKQTSNLVQRQQPKSQANKENKKHVYSIKPPNNGGEIFQITEFYSCQIYHCISVFTAQIQEGNKSILNF